MLDWGKYTTTAANPEYLRTHPDLHLRESVTISTAEIHHTVKNGRDFKGLHLALKGNCLTVWNSLHGFHHRGNSSDFSASDLRDSITRLCTTLDIPPEAFDIRPRFEWGVNVTCNPQIIHRLRAGMNGKPFIPMKPEPRKGGKVEGYHCQNSTLRLKVYEKVIGETVRVEIVIHRPDKVCPWLKTLADFLRPETIHRMNNLFLSMLDTITLKQDLASLPDMKPGQLEKIALALSSEYAAFMNVLKAKHPASYKKKRKEYQNLLSKLPETDPVRADFIALVRAKVRKMAGDDSSPFSAHVIECGNGIQEGSQTIMK